MIAATTLSHDLKPGTKGMVNNPYNDRLVEGRIDSMTDEFTPNGRRLFVVLPTNKNQAWVLKTSTIYLTD